MAKSTQKKIQNEPVNEIAEATDRLIGVDRNELAAAVESARARVATASEAVQRAQAELKSASLAAARGGDAARGAQQAAHVVVASATRELTLARDSEAAAVEVLGQHDRDAAIVAEADRQRAAASELVDAKRKALKLVREIDAAIEEVRRLQHETRNALVRVNQLAPHGTAERLSNRELDASFEVLGLRAWAWRPGRHDAIKSSIVGRPVPSFLDTYAAILT